MKHVISILMENEPGALSRVAGLFSARGYNIQSLTVAETEDPTLSRMTIVTTGSERIIEQITKQLNKLVDVVKLIDMNDCRAIERELMLIKCKAQSSDAKDELKRLTEIFRGRILDVSSQVYVIEMTGASDKCDAFINACGRNLILEVVRTGVSGICRGEKSLRV